MLRRTLTGLTPALDAALDSLPASALERAATELVATSRTSFGPALERLDAWLEGRPIDDALLASFVEELVEKGCSHRAASEVVAAARLRARFAGTECPAGPATSGILARADPRRRSQRAGIGWQDLTRAVSRIEKESLTGARDATIIVVGSDADLSVNEMIALDVEDLIPGNEEGWQLRVRAPVSERKAEMVILDQATVRRLRAWLNEAEIMSGPMFRRMQNAGCAGEQRMTERGIRLLVTRRAYAAGIPDACFRPLAMGQRRERVHAGGETRVRCAENEAGAAAVVGSENRKRPMGGKNQ